MIWKLKWIFFLCDFLFFVGWDCEFEVVGIGGFLVRVLVRVGELLINNCGMKDLIVVDKYM